MTVKYASLHAAIVIDSSNNLLRLDEAGTVADATIAPGVYYLRGDGSTGDVCLAIQDALDAAIGGNTYAVTTTTDGSTASWDIDPANVHAKVHIAIATGSTNFRVKWADGSATFDGLIIGFVTTKAAANTTAEVSTLSPTCVWVANDAYRERRRTRMWRVAEQPTADGDHDVVRRSSKTRSDVLQFRFLDERRIFIEAQSSSSSWSRTLEYFIDQWGDGRSLELHERGIISGTLLDAATDDTIVGGINFSGGWRLGQAAQTLDPTRVEPGLALFDLDLELVGAES